MMFPSIFSVKIIKKEMNDCQYADKILTYYNYLKIRYINILKSVT